MARGFKTQKDFRDWLEKHHARENELMLRLFKVHAKDRGIGYRQALDEALCYGWIDGVRRGLDADSFAQRFTPRQPKSNWSAVNIKRATELESEGKMHPAGLKAFHARDKSKAPYSFESPPKELDAASRKKVEANKAAWGYYQAQAPWYRRTSAFWVMEAKRPETREKRLGILIDCSADGRPIPLLTRRK